MGVERQVLLVVRGVQWPVGRRPTPVAKGIGVAEMQCKYNILEF